MSFLRAVHRHARPRTYLEIGIYEGESLRLAGPSTRVIGIDPQPRCEPPYPPNWCIHAQTSDAFFARSDLAEMVGAVDIAFVDGLHHFEQTLRDLENVERLMSRRGVVLIHDVVPPAPSWAGRAPGPADGWAGDVWKVLPILREHRPDLRIAVVDAAPTGLAVVTGLDPSSTRLDAVHDEAVARWMDAPYRAWPDPPLRSWSEAADRFPVFQRRHLRDELAHNRRRARYLARRLMSARPGVR